MKLKRVVNFRLTIETYQLAQARAKAEGITLSQKIRWLVKQWIREDGSTRMHEGGTEHIVICCPNEELNPHARGENPFKVG